MNPAQVMTGPANSCCKKLGMLAWSGLGSEGCSQAWAHASDSTDACNRSQDQAQVRRMVQDLATTTVLHLVWAVVQAWDLEWAVDQVRDLEWAVDRVWDLEWAVVQDLVWAVVQDLEWAVVQDLVWAGMVQALVMRMECSGMALVQAGQGQALVMITIQMTIHVNIRN